MKLGVEVALEPAGPVAPVAPLAPALQSLQLLRHDIFFYGNDYVYTYDTSTFLLIN